MIVDMKSLARLGAQVRIAELAAEMDALLNAFPDLSASTVPAVKPVAEVPDRTTPERKPRKRHRMSAAERKAVSLRMKRYWSERRKTKE